MDYKLKKLNIKNTFALLIVSILFVSVESYATPPNPIQYRDARFKDLQSLDELVKLFEKDSGKIRLFLLMSPT